MIARAHDPLTRLTWLVFALLFACYGAFASGLQNYNTISRIALTANLVQHGRLDIDGYDKLTADKAFHDGHFYTDKAPGMSFLAAPAAFVFTRFAPVDAAVDFTRPDTARRNLSLLIYVCTLFTSGLVTALAGAMMFAYVARRTGDAGAGLVAALTYGAATPTWEWATSLFGHAGAGAALLIGFILLHRAIDLARWSAEKVRAAALSGVAFAVAATIEFTAAVAAAIIVSAVAATAYARRRTWRRSVEELAVVGAAGVLAIMPLLVYNNAVFGSPFHLGYSNVVGFAGMKTGFFGISAPDLSVAWELTFGLYRGIVWLSPVIVLAFAAACLQAAKSGARLIGAIALMLSAYYLAINSGYAYWDGGFSTGPRHLTPIYPFLALALGAWYAAAAAPLRAAVAVTLALSIVVSLACAAVETMAPVELSAPLFQLILPSFARGDLPQSMVQILTHRHGLWQLAPLAAIAAAIAIAMVRPLRQARAL